MSEKDNTLDIIKPSELTMVSSEEIDGVIARMIEESKDNYEEIQGLALECSAALSAGQARSFAMAERGFFKRNWDKLTGKDDKLRGAIARDQFAAQYAMQQTIVRVLDECNRNQRLAMAIGEEMHKEVLRLEGLRIAQNEEIVRIRSALVHFYNGYQDKFREWEAEQKRIDNWAGKRCEYCREPMEQEQLICPRCGTIQELKLEKLPVKMQNELKELARLMKADPSEWDIDITWDQIARKYAETMAKVKKISQNAGVLLPGSQLDNDIMALINKCKTSEFHIAIVGVLKAGKSLLLNAFIGADLAAVGLNSTTAALTKFRSSRKGHYIKVRFYNQAEWEELNQSVAGMHSKSKKFAEGQDISLFEMLNKESVQQAAKKWIGQKSKTYRYPDLNTLKEGIVHWTAANSYDHLFVAEVEVGIDKDVFDMPEDVIFVDTPGLHDPVKYRSRITEKYIRTANAVLVAVKPDALTDEAFSTITTVLDYAGSNSNKVYIVGTQKDKLQGVTDYEDIINGPGGWSQQLAQAGRYKDKRAAARKICTVSAYLHLCMKKMLREGPDALNDVEYNDLGKSAAKILERRRLLVEDILDNNQDKEKLIAEFGIVALRERLNRELIQKYRVLKIRDIADDYARCKRALSAQMREELDERKEKVRVARQGAYELKEGVAKAKKEKEDLEKSKKQLMDELEKLQNFTRKRILGLNMYKG